MCIAFNTIAQNHDAGQTVNVKTRYYIQTIFGPGATKHIDTVDYDAFNTAQKSVTYNSYHENRVNSSFASAFDAKGQIVSMTEKTDNTVTGRRDHFYDAKGNIVRSIKHYFARQANGSVKELQADTNMQAFDKAGNKISIDTRTSRETSVFDSHNRLIERDFYMQRNGKAQKTINVYQGNLLTETLSYWYDGKLYHRVTNQYNEKQQLTNARDSTTDWSQEINYTYNDAGLKASEVSQKKFRDKESKTTTEYTYDTAGRLLVQDFHSNDHFLLALFPLSYRLKEPDYELKDTYAYDQYGNRLQITSELNGEKVRVIDFLMTYY